jgi:hypothetical protein
VTWSTPPIYSPLWSERLSRILDAIKACGHTFIVSRSWLALIAAETGAYRAGQAISLGDRILVNIDAIDGESQQEFDTIYWQCEYWLCDCPDCQAGKVCYCDSLNVPTMGLHKLIIPPIHLTLDQAETYTVLRLDGMKPIDALEAAELLA